MKANLGHIGNNINSNMINWVNKPYNELQDMSITASQLLAQILAASLGMVALMAICYGLVKLLTREK